MARITMEEQQEFVVFPVDSLLLLKVDDCRLKDVEGRDGRDGWTKCEFKFKILEVLAAGDGGPVNRFDDMVGKEIWGSVSWRLTDSPENKLRIWAEALLQVELGLGFELDSDMFASRVVKGVTSQYDGRATNPTTGQRYKRHQIETLIAAPGTSGLANPAQQAALNGQYQAPAAQQGWGAPPQGQGFAQQQHQAYQQPQAPAAQGQWGAPGVQQPVQQQPVQQAPQQPQQQGQWAQQQNLMQQGQQAQPQQGQVAPVVSTATGQPVVHQQQVPQDPWQPQEPPAVDPWALPPAGDQPDF